MNNREPGHLPTDETLFHEYWQLEEDERDETTRWGLTADEHRKQRSYKRQHIHDYLLICCY